MYKGNGGKVLINMNAFRDEVYDLKIILSQGSQNIDSGMIQRFSKVLDLFEKILKKYKRIKLENSQLTTEIEKFKFELKNKMNKKKA